MLRLDEPPFRNNSQKKTTTVAAKTHWRIDELTSWGIDERVSQWWSTYDPLWCRRPVLLCLFLPIPFEWALLYQVCCDSHSLKRHVDQLSKRTATPTNPKPTLPDEHADEDAIEGKSFQPRAKFFTMYPLPLIPQLKLQEMRYPYPCLLTVLQPFQKKESANRPLIYLTVMLDLFMTKISVIFMGRIVRYQSQKNGSYLCKNFLWERETRVLGRMVPTQAKNKRCFAGSLITSWSKLIMSGLFRFVLANHEGYITTTH